MLYTCINIPFFYFNARICAVRYPELNLLTEFWQVLMQHSASECKNSKNDSIDAGFENSLKELRQLYMQRSDDAGFEKLLKELGELYKQRGASKSPENSERVQNLESLETVRCCCWTQDNFYFTKILIADALRKPVLNPGVPDIVIAKQWFVLMSMLFSDLFF